MAGRIVVWGATGYTGRLVVEELVRAGVSPVLAGRDAGRLDAAAADLGQGLETAVADARSPDRLAGLLQRGDVLVATVGPFARFGTTAVRAAIEGGAWYVDSTGEGGFIREVFERHGPDAAVQDTGLLTAFGYDWVPGHFAGELALRQAGASAVRLDVGYFTTGDGAFAMSGGTRASAVGGMLEPTFAWRGGRIVTEPAGRRGRSFTVEGRSRPAMSVGSSEHFSLPRLHPELEDIGTYLGWFGTGTPLVRGLNLGMAAAAQVPVLADVLRGALGRVTGSSGGPDGPERERTGSHVVAIARDRAGTTLAEVHLDGVNPYTFTARAIAWAARRAADRGMEGTGALGPVEAFGLEALEDGVTGAGLHRVAP